MTVNGVPHKALIIASPSIERILAGEKTWEMRSRNCKIRGTIGLIRKGSGQVVGLARVVDAKGPLTRDDLLANVDKHRRTLAEIDGPKLAKRNIAWVLADARPLLIPIPYAHKPGSQIWVMLDEGVRAQIARQTGLKFVPAPPTSRAPGKQQRLRRRRQPPKTKTSGRGSKSSGVGAVCLQSS